VTRGFSGTLVVFQSAGNDRKVTAALTKSNWQLITG